ncbi:hypothetical protein KKC97_11940 [bacterium]|nr:hypothetical protein [bacterium]MBU1638365.1 hypothetical protein [bacterium]RQV99457.1 MAG: hypothetical protein EH220_01665 [bacterium]
MLSKLLIPIVLVFATIAYAGVELLSFRALPMIDHGRLEWSSGAETNLDAFIVERSPDGQNFLPITRVDATGSYSEYTFTDSSPLDLDMDRSFYYRLKMLDNDGTYRYSEVKEVTLTFSAVQQTWGSIKAMFR